MKLKDKIGKIFVHKQDKYDKVKLLGIDKVGDPVLEGLTPEVLEGMSLYTEDDLEEDSSVTVGAFGFSEDYFNEKYTELEE